MNSSLIGDSPRARQQSLSEVDPNVDRSDSPSLVHSIPLGLIYPSREFGDCYRLVYPMICGREREWSEGSVD